MTLRRAYMAGFGSMLLAAAPAMVLAAGTDERATGLVRELAPEYHPWFTALFIAPSGVESWLFALQAGLGLAGLTACLVLLRRRFREGRKETRHAD